MLFHTVHSSQYKLWLRYIGYGYSMAKIDRGSGYEKQNLRSVRDVFSFALVNKSL